MLCIFSASLWLVFKCLNRAFCWTGFAFWFNAECSFSSMLRYPDTSKTANDLHYYCYIIPRGHAEIFFVHIQVFRSLFWQLLPLLLIIFGNAPSQVSWLKPGCIYLPISGLESTSPLLSPAGRDVVHNQMNLLTLLIKYFTEQSSEIITQQ